MKILIKCHYCGFNFKRHISEIKRANLRGYKNFFCSNKCTIKYNYNINKNIVPKKNREKYYQNPKKCLYCNSIISYEKKNDNLKYCSHKCAAIHTQKNGSHRKWNKSQRNELRKISQKNPYFNGTIVLQKKNGMYLFCPICNIKFYTPQSLKKICCSKKCSIEWIKKTGYLKGKTGGYRSKGGRGKQGWYKGYYCNSSWELAWVIYQLDHGIFFKRNTTGFEYEFEEKKYKFYPDFQLKDLNTFVEIKAYIDKKNSAKLLFFPYNLKIIGKEEIKPFINYTIKKYGKNYIDLYES